MRKSSPLQTSFSCLQEINRLALIASRGGSAADAKTVKAVAKAVPLDAELWRAATEVSRMRVS